MKTTAKISLLIALALCITIGGVYATWTYVEETFNDVAAPGTSAPLVPAIAAYTLDSDNVSRGTITVTGAPTLTIDQLDNTFAGKLTWVNPEYTVKYTPATSENTNDVQPIDKININCTITVKQGVDTFNNQFTLADNTTVNVFVIETDIPQLEAVGAGGKTFDLSTYLTLADNFELPTHADYTAFKALLETLTITVTFSDATTGS